LPVSASKPSVASFALDDIMSPCCASREGWNVQREEGSRRDKSRSLVARAAVLREIEILKPADEPPKGWCEVLGCNENERIGGLESE
jgi:hypothetical protein